jgi:hypothetical protein
MCSSFQNVRTDDVPFFKLLVWLLSLIHPSEMALNLVVPLQSLFASSRLQSFSSKWVSSCDLQEADEFCRSTSIPRKFKWSGELRMNTEKDHKERLCNVTLSDTSDGCTTRLRFSICFGPSVSFLLLEKLISLGELQCLRPALTPVAEIGKLGPESQADEKPISTLFYYMSPRKLARPPTLLPQMN